MSSFPLYAAAILTFAVGLVHSWLGERRLIGPLLAPDGQHGILARSGFARNVLRFAWHLTTIAWWAMGAVFVVLAASPIDGTARAVLGILATAMLVTGLLTLVVSRGRHLAWPVFLAIAGLAARSALV